MASPGRPLPSSFDGDENFMNENAWQKIGRKLKEEPLIPLGSALTVYAFVSAYRAMRRGDAMGAQRMFRARVMAQGFTVMAMLAGAMYYNKDRERSKELRKLKEQQDAEEKRAKWIRELEARDEEERSIKRRLEEKRNANTDQLKKKEAETKEGGGGVLGALGLWKSKEGAAKTEGGEKKDEDEKTTEGKGESEQGKRQRNPRSSLGSLGEIVAGQSKKDSPQKDSSEKS